MLTTKKKNAYIGMGFGLILQIAGVFVKSSVGMDDALSAILFISGYSLLIWGCWLYAGEKGYSGVWKILGIFSLIGFIILFFLKDKSTQ